MRRLLLVAACVGAAAGCRIEDHTPAGTRRDEVAVQDLLARYTRGLDRRDWDRVRSLFWRNGMYSGPLIPRSAGNPVSIDIGPAASSPSPSAVHEAGTFQVRSCAPTSARRVTWRRPG